MFVFLGGIALLGLTFWLAYRMFTTPAQTTLGIQTNKPVDLGLAASALIGSLFRVIVLLLMAFVSSSIANRGIHLYTQSRAHADDRGSKHDASDEVARFTAEGGREAS